MPSLSAGASGAYVPVADGADVCLFVDFPAMGRTVTFHFADIKTCNQPHRDRDRVEVHIVIEIGKQFVAGVEVKAGATVTPAEFRGLRKLKAVSDSRFAGGTVAYKGETCVSHGDEVYAVPLRLLWETPKEIT